MQKYPHQYCKSLVQIGMIAAPEQVSWELMQSEGTPLSSSSDGGAPPEVGVYVGIQQMEYGGMAAPYLSKIGPFSATGGPFSVAAGRMSFIYGLKGPAVRSLPAFLFFNLLISGSAQCWNTA